MKQTLQQLGDFSSEGPLDILEILLFILISLISDLVVLYGYGNLHIALHFVDQSYLKLDF